VCTNEARTDLWGGHWVTGGPTRTNLITVKGARKIRNETGRPGTVRANDQKMWVAV
jgi:hypothetical protein